MRELDPRTPPRIRNARIQARYGAFSTAVADLATASSQGQNVALAKRKLEDAFNGVLEEIYNAILAPLEASVEEKPSSSPNDNRDGPEAHP